MVIAYNYSLRFVNLCTINIYILELRDRKNDNTKLKIPSDKETSYCFKTSLPIHMLSTTKMGMKLTTAVSSPKF